MGLFDVLSGRVVLDYQVKVDQAKIAVRDLAGEQKKAAKDAIQGMEDQQKAHERMVKGMTIGLGIATGAIALGVAGFKKYEEATRLTAASSGADISKLRTASKGLLTDIELMQVAAVGMNGKWKLTSAEMENVLGAARALELRGIMPLSEAAMKLGEAVKKGETEPLKELGIAYDEALAKTDKRAAAMKALGALSAESARVTTTETEAIRAHGTEFRNTVDGIGEAIGRLVVALGPLIGSLASVVNLASEAIQGWGTIWTSITGPGVADEAEARKLIDSITGGAASREVALKELFAGIVPGYESLEKGQAARQADRERAVDDASAEQLARQRGAVAAQKRRMWSAAAPDDRQRAQRARDFSGAENTMRDAVERLVKWAETQPGIDARVLAVLGEEYQSQAGGVGGLDFSGALRDDGGPSIGGLGAAATSEGPSFLERTFGTKDEILDYAKSIQAPFDAVAAGYEAIVTGSESAGKAMKRIIGQAILAEGTRMMVLAAREAASAIAALATGNFAAAGTHGIAAAKFAAGAALAGVAARGLGANSPGGWGGASASGGGGSGASGGGVAPPAPINRTIVLGHGWDDESPRQRAARLARANRIANGYEPPPRGSEYS